MEHKLISTQNYKIGCAQIGYGYFGKIINSYIIQNPQLNLHGTYWPSQTQENETTYNQNIQNILNDQRVPVIFIITPLKTHFQLALSALNANKHVFIEKPTCLTFAETAYLHSLAQEKNLVLFTDYTFAYSPSIQQLAKELQSNSIGEIEYVKLRMLQWGRFGRESAILMLGSHLLSILNTLFSKNQITFENIQTTQAGKEEATINLLIDKVIPVELQISLLHNERIRDGIVQGKNGTLKYQLQGQNQWTYTKHQIDRNTQHLKLDETNTLNNSISAFLKTLQDRENPNRVMSLNVSAVLEKIHETFH